MGHRGKRGERGIGDRVGLGVCLRVVGYNNKRHLPLLDNRFLKIDTRVPTRFVQRVEKDLGPRITPKSETSDKTTGSLVIRKYS